MNSGFHPDFPDRHPVDPNDSIMKVLPCVLALVAAPLSALALPTGEAALATRQWGGGGQQAPPPCVRQDPPPSQEELEERFRQFVDYFVGPRKNLYEAFKFIAADYIVRSSETPRSFQR
jgi:hypothetical protein